MSYPKLRFLGAAGTVTGSCYVLEHQGRRVVVDCGMFQGSKTLRELNYGAFPFEAKEVDAVLLTHAHLDHSGLLPKLRRAGYARRIFTTVETRDLLRFVLPDAGAIQESEVERLNRRRTKRGERPVLPIYTRLDAERVVDQITPVRDGETTEVTPGIRARFWPAAHILGAVSVELTVEGVGERPLRLVFSGDLGADAANLAGPAAGADYVVMEATYGDRDRERLTTAERRAILADEVRAALKAGGNLLIPAFAVERTQALLYDLAALFEEGALEPVEVFIDSPLATRITEVFDRYGEEGDARPELLKRRGFHFVEDVEASKRLNTIRSGAIIIAGSGMCEAGRIRHHLCANLWRPEATVLLVGYQAPGTLGRLIQSGTQAVRIMGEEVQVGARIRTLDTYSAHADQSELLAWLAARRPIGSALVLTHGEPTATAALAAAASARFGPEPPVLMPGLGAVLALDRARPPLLEPGAPRLPAPDLGRADWHNDYAAFLLALSAALRRAPDDKRRATILTRVAAALKRPD
jgi:metallo-beta-lactamase family protein